MIMAILGFNVLVVTTVAIALGPSVQPLIKTTPKFKSRAIIAHGCWPNN